MSKHTHLTFDERCSIQNMLNNKCSLRSIAIYLGRDVSTISREVRFRCNIKESGCWGHQFNNCKNRKGCRKNMHCNNTKCTSARCNACGLCRYYCDHYVKEYCSRLKSHPYVCNGCSHRHHCTLEKHVYSAVYANHDYRVLMHEARSGATIDEKESIRLDNLISPLLEKGQSIHHIMLTHRSEIMYSEKTIYNYLDLGMFTAKNIDLPRKVRFRPRKSRHEGVKIDKKCRIGRTMDDFKEFLKGDGDVPLVEMDSVIGSAGGKCLLTLHFVKAELMLAFLRDANTARSVKDIFDSLYEKLGYETFVKLFPVILTDNGSEFSDPVSIETDSDGVVRTHIFYCDPSSPYQKGAVENNHELIRRILPKSTTMNDLTQEKVDLMMDHINSYKRENLAGRSPCEAFEFLYGKDVLNQLGVNLINPNDITLRPALIR